MKALELREKTAQELTELTARVEALFARFDERAADASTRPGGARAVQIIQLAMPLAPPAPLEPDHH